MVFKCLTYQLEQEVASKPQIRLKGKAQADRESAAYMGYVSIYRRLCCTLRYKIRCESRSSGATQPLGLRWGFETTSRVHTGGLR